MKGKTMASKTKDEAKPKGAPRAAAAVDTIDFTATAGEAELATVASVKTSKWTNLLDSLYTATEEGKVTRDADGKLNFIRLGNFKNPGGARTQVKVFEDKKLDETYDFKCVVKGKESFLWARVKEVNGS